MHSYIIWSGAVILLVLGGLGVAGALDSPEDKASKGESIAVSLYSAQSATGAWQWHRSNPLPMQWYGVVGSAEEMQKLIADNPSWTERLPAQIDWSKEALVVAALGEAPTGGYAVRIKQITRIGEQVRVLLHQRSPGPADMVIQMITYPVDSIRLPKDQVAGKGLSWEFVDQNGTRLYSCRWP